MLYELPKKCRRWSILSNSNVCLYSYKKLCNDVVNLTDLWSSISLISETGSLKVTLSGRVPGNIFCFWINSSNQLWPQRTDLSGPKESFYNQEEISIQIGFIGLPLKFFSLLPNKNRWLFICHRTFLSNNFIPLLLKNFSRKGEVRRELSLNVLIQFGGERKRVQSIFNHQTLWNNMLDDFPSLKIQISHFSPPNSLKNKNDFISSNF